MLCVLHGGLPSLECGVQHPQHPVCLELGGWFAANSLGEGLMSCWLLEKCTRRGHEPYLLPLTCHSLLCSTLVPHEALTETCSSM